jgi:ribosomal protein S18 acetylase RimI-like enzyme
MSIGVIGYTADEHGRGVRHVLQTLGWEQRFVDGQLEAIARPSAVAEGCVYVAVDRSGVVGYASAVFERWNRLGHIHGLAVLPAARRRGVAAALVGAVENFLRQRGARGVRVDTPVDNLSGRRFYEATGFAEDYVMTRYYADDLDGVTYVRFFET